MAVYRRELPFFRAAVLAEMFTAQGRSSGHVFERDAAVMIIAPIGPRQDEGRGEGDRCNDPAVYAVAELLQVLSSGEDSAASTFEHLARGCRNESWYSTVKSIAADEFKHQAWLKGLLHALPVLPPDIPFQRMLRRFFCQLAHADPQVHFARIFALDSAVCQLLSVMQSRRIPPVARIALSPVIGCIQRDEARHVAFAKQAAGPLLQTPRGRDFVAEVREGLIQVLAWRVDAFETLEVDPDVLWLRLRRKSSHSAFDRCA
jgi:hypothetical protein